MWARTAEVLFGAWLLISPFVFDHPTSATLLWTTDFACGTLVCLISLAAHMRRFRRVHLLNLPIGLWLALAGYLGSAAGSGGSQNEIFTGLLLLMLAIVPSDAAEPPAAWRHQSR